ncbi:MAG: sialate O-acetylesterase [Verrucomicrobiota bacterium]
MRLKCVDLIRWFRPVAFLLFAWIGVGLSNAWGTVAVSPLYGNNMVIQRDQPFPVRGTAAPNKTITVSYNSQTTNTTSDAQGNWQVSLAAMSAKASGSNFTIAEAGGNTLTFSNVVVGDVWLCSGQSNMAIDVNYCQQPADVSSANFPGIRYFGVPLANLGAPSTSFNGNVSWSICSPSTVGGYSAAAFYFARTIYTNQNSTVPIGLKVSSVGGTRIDPWVGPEGITDIPVLAPLYAQANPAYGPFSLFNGMIYPLSPCPVKGVLWYQGENAETSTQSTDSYYLKDKGLINGWKRLLGVGDCAFYVVQIARWGAEPTSPTPALFSGGWDADTRLQQGNVINLPHAGVASALDIGDSSTGDNIWLGWHPTNKWDVGFRLALWAMKNDYGQSNLVASGPVLRDVTVSGNVATCTFDYAGSGLMAGFKPPYGTAQPTNAPLALFSIAGANGTWYWATATIVGSNTLQLSSPSVTTPKMVAYACWQNPVGANLYNSNGLPALPFYVADVNAKFTVTASAGAGGSISPAGASSYLKRMTALYTITPDAGQYIQDVLVDGVSVGAVTAYTFDPLDANHTIAASFSSVQPTNTVTATASGGGTITPAGAVQVPQGETQSFLIKPNPGLSLSVVVDGKPMGPRNSFIFPDVRANHSIAASFYCTVNASAGFGGSISSPGISNIVYGTDATYTITPAPTYSILKVTVDGINVGPVSSYTFTNITTNHTISASFAGGTPGGSVPQTNQLLFSCLADSFQTNSAGTITSWPTYLPTRPALTPMGNPTPKLAMIDGRPFARNEYLNAPNGFNQGAYASPIPCSGATIIVVAKPIRNGVTGGWGCVVDAFYNQLSLGILNDSGKIFVLRNGIGDTSAASIPDGQTTILSLVVQPNGQYVVWANGSAIFTNNNLSSFTSLVNGVAGSFANNIALGNNYPDSWSTYNGYIGDVFFYTNALPNADRQLLEQYLATRLMSGNSVNHTINASAGAGGTITPTGAVLVPSGSNQSFTITPAASPAGWAVSDVVVDGVSQGAITSYTFLNVTTNHTIAASFVYNGYTITATAGAGGSISPSGTVLVPSGSDQSFTITALAGGAVSNVLVDGVSLGAITGYTFTNVAANHTIEATFSYTNYTINASAAAGGSITPSGAVTVPYGTTQSFSITANAGYAVSNVVVDSVNKGALASYTFTNVTADHTIAASFSAVPALGGTISVNYSQAGDVLAPTAVAGAVPTNHWNSIVWGSAGRYSNPTNVFYDCSGASVATFHVTLSKDGFDTWNSGNSSQPNPTLYADWALSGGGTATFSGIPYSTYDLYVYFNGYNGVNVLNYTIGGNTRTLTDSSNLAYQFTPPFVEGTDYVKFTGLTGSNQVMTVTGVSGGSAYGMAAFQIVQSIVNHTITAAAGTGGSITPSGAVSVTAGSNQAFSIAPASGYAISGVTVDGVGQGAVSSYTFTNVTAAHSISASFVSLPPPTLTIAVNGTGGLEITWPDTYSGTLLTSPVIGPGAVWSPVDGAPAHVGGVYKITVNPGSDTAFYGLSQ